MSNEKIPRVAFYPGLQLRADDQVGTVFLATDRSVTIDWPGRTDCANPEVLLKSIQFGDVTVEPAAGMRIKTRVGIYTINRVTDIGCFIDESHSLRSTLDWHVRTGAWAILPPEPVSIDGAPTSTGDDVETSAPAVEPTSDDLSAAIDARRLEELALSPVLSQDARDRCRAAAEQIVNLSAQLLVERAERQKAEDRAAATECERNSVAKKVRALEERQELLFHALDHLAGFAGGQRCPDELMMMDDAGTNVGDILSQVDAYYTEILVCMRRGRDAEQRVDRVERERDAAITRAEAADGEAAQRRMEIELAQRLGQIRLKAADERAEAAERRADRLEAYAKLTKESKLLCEEVFHRLDSFIDGNEQMAFSAGDLDAAVKAGVDTRQALGFYKRILGALTRAKEMEARAREAVDGGLARVCDEAIVAEFMRRLGPTEFGWPNDSEAWQTIAGAWVSSVGDDKPIAHGRDCVGAILSAAKAHRERCRAELTGTGCRNEDNTGHATPTSFAALHWGPAYGLDAGGGF